jgi:hypothetical protein
MNNPEKLHGSMTHELNSNDALNSLSPLQISLGIVTLFEQIYNGEPILSVFSVIGENVHCTKPLFQVSDLKCMCRSPT